MHAYKMAAASRPGLMRRPARFQSPVAGESKPGHAAGKPLTKRIEEEADKWTFSLPGATVGSLRTIGDRLTPSENGGLASREGAKGMGE